MKVLTITLLSITIFGCSMVSPRSEIAEYVSSARWNIESGEKANDPYLLRYRTPLLSSQQVGEYTHLLRVVWIYADENTGALPTSADLDLMNAFEELLQNTIENDSLSILAAVLTFDGARQWVFYTTDVKKCSERIDSWPQTAEPYPIEIDTFIDSEWEYLRNEILQGRT